MSLKKLKKAVGNWVIEDRFWNRDAEVQLLTEHLEEGAHILIVAQRRIGKTSLMRETARRLSSRFICLHVDLQKASTAADAVVELSIATQPYHSLWEVTKSLFGNILATIGEKVETLKLSELTVQLRSGLTAGTWQAKGDELFSTLASAEKGVVVFLDEVPILVNRMLKGDDYTTTSSRRQQVDAFMSWLRENCIRHRGKVRVVVTGSIGLEPLLRQAGLSATVNVLTPFELGPWDRRTAAGCLEALANQYDLRFQPPAIDAVLDRLGVYIPHHVQLFFDNLYVASKQQKRTEIDANFVEEIYQTKMLSVRGHAELSHLEERLGTVLGPERLPLALDLLTEAAISRSLSAKAAIKLAAEHLPAKKRSQDEVREILLILEHDGYLRREENNLYSFNSNLLRDWWRARFGFGFTPALERQV